MTGAELNAPPEQDSLREALKLNDAHISGLTRLDQQLVYVPLVALAGAISLVVTKPSALALAASSSAAIAGAVLLVVGLGLWRNQRRHRDLLIYRAALIEGLRLPPEARRDPLVWGRLVYVGLLAIGLTIGWFVLLALTWSASVPRPPL